MPPPKRIFSVSAPEPVRAPVPPPAAPVGNKYVAIYDYAAADDDEVIAEFILSLLRRARLLWQSEQIS